MEDEQQTARSGFRLWWVLVPVGLIAIFLVYWFVRPTTTARFVLDIEEARKAGRIAADADVAQITADVGTILEQRLEAGGASVWSVETVGAGELEIAFRGVAKDELDRVLESVSRLGGDLRFRIEVLPDEEYERRCSDMGNGMSPKRRGVWPQGDATSFKAFKEKEIALWREARDAGERYVPSDPRFRLVKDARADGTEARDFHVLEEVNLPYPFDGSILAEPRVSVDQSSMPVVLFDIRNEYQNVFGNWTAANVGLPMALVYDDEWRSAPVIMSELTTNVQITLGRAGREQEAREMVLMLQAAPLGVRVKVVSVETD